MKMLGRKRTLQVCNWGCCDDQSKYRLGRIHKRNMKFKEKRQWKKEVLNDVST